MGPSGAAQADGAKARIASAEIRRVGCMVNPPWGLPSYPRGDRVAAFAVAGARVALPLDVRTVASREIQVHVDRPRATSSRPGAGADRSRERGHACSAFDHA